MSNRNDNPGTAIAQAGASLPQADFVQAEAVRSFGDLMSNPAAISNAWKLAQILANSGMVPKNFQHKNEACFVALTLSQELGENPLVLMQNMHLVHGQPGFSAKYMLGRLIQSGRIRGTVSYTETGAPGRQDYAVTASAIDRSTGAEVSFTASMEMARAEGWTKNTKYKSMPHVMLRYRAVTFLVRMHYPDVMLGYHTVEELQDVRAGAQVVQPAPTSAAAALTGPTEEVPPVLGIDEQAAAMVMETDKPDLIARYREHFGAMPPKDMDEMGMARALLADAPPAD